MTCRHQINEAIRLLVDNGYTITNGRETARPVNKTVTHIKPTVDPVATARLYAQVLTPQG